MQVKRKRSRQFLFIMITFLMVTGTMELIIRAFDPIGIEYFAEAGRYFRSMVLDDTYAYSHRPNYRGSLQGVDVSINSQGFRGPEFKAEKAEGKGRLLILGDSMVFGWGVEQSAIFPARLQDMLDKENKNVEVIAAGVGSWNTRTEYEYFRSKGIGLDPDVVVLLITSNDLEPKRQGHTDVSKALLFPDTDRTGTARQLVVNVWRDFVSRSYLLSYIQYFVKIRSTKREYAAVSEESPQWEDAKLALDGMIDICRSKGIPLITYLYAPEASVGNDKVLGLYKRHLGLRDVPVFAFPAELFGKREYRNSTVDSHPNADGHALIAEEMYRVLAPPWQKRPARLNKPDTDSTRAAAGDSLLCTGVKRPVMINSGVPWGCAGLKSNITVI